MSIDELVTTFTVAYWGANNGPADRTNARAGVTAIVRALRDEIDRIWTSDDMGCGTIIAVFNEILGSDAGEKVAEMPDLPTRTVQLTGITKSQRPDIQFEPATDAAPAVMDEAYKELVKRLRDVETRERILGFGGSETLLLFSKEAADALEAMAGEVDKLKWSMEWYEDRAEAAEAERDRLKAELNDNSALSHLAGWKVRALKAEAQRDRLKDALQEQHAWHLNAGVVGMPDGNGGWVEIDNAAEYSDSPLCSQTIEALGDAS
jgi:hypothetical protein